MNHTTPTFMPNQSMRTISLQTALTFGAGLLALMSAANHLQAATLYVDASGSSSTPPYASLATAAAELQVAVDAASAGDTILVAPGTYASGGDYAPGSSLLNRLMADKAISIQSIDGAESTIIEGNAAGAPTAPYPTGDDAVRPVYLSGGAELIGFTLQNGATLSCLSELAPINQSGGGVFIDGSGIVRECIITGNTAELRGGGAYLEGGGEIHQSILSQNTAVAGGGAFLHRGGTLMDSIIEDNRIDPDYSGAGVALTSGGLVSGCTIRANLAERPDRATFVYHEVPSHGGGVYIAYSGTVRNSLIEDNQSTFQGGGAFLLLGGFLENCVITNNSARDLTGDITAAGSYSREGNYTAGAAVKMHEGGGLSHCTIVDNEALGNGFAGGVYIHESGDIGHSIVYGNSGSNADNWVLHEVSSPSLANLCTSPVEGALLDTGSTDGDPNFSDGESRDYRLNAGSSCIDAANGSTTSDDFLGHPRPLDGNSDGIVEPDIGAYERIDPYADTDSDSIRDYWEIEQGLNATQDDAALDPDKDGLSNLEEWFYDSAPRVRTPPFAMQAIAESDHRWRFTLPSSSRRLYTLFRATDLIAANWTAISESSEISGNDSLLTLYDTNPPTDTAALFWRVQVDIPQ